MIKKRGFWARALGVMLGLAFAMGLAAALAWLGVPGMILVTYGLAPGILLLVGVLSLCVLVGVLCGWHASYLLAASDRRTATATHRALEASFGGPSPIEEQLFSAMIALKGLPRPLRQYAFYHEGSLITVADFAFPSERVAVYCDGHLFHSTKEALSKDASKRNWLQRQGWVVLQFRGSQVFSNAVKCAEEVLDTVRVQRGASPILEPFRVPVEAGESAPVQVASRSLVLRCPKCKTMVHATPGVQPICPACGYVGRIPIR